MKDEDLPEYTWFEKHAPSLQTVSFPALGDAEPNSSSTPTPVSPTDASSDHDHDDHDYDHDDHDYDHDDDHDDHDVVVTRVDQRSTAPYSRVESNIPSPVHVQSTGSHHTIWEEVARDQQYKRLLREVIRQARRGGRSPQGRGVPLSLDEIDEALDELARPPADYAAFYRTVGNTRNGRFEENARMGAAGELYVSLGRYPYTSTVADLD